MKRSGYSRLASLALAVALVLNAGLTHAVAAPFENAIADDCILFINIADSQSLREQMASTHLAQLCKDPQMQPFLNGLETELKKTLATLFDKSGVDLEQVLSIPKGQISLAVSVKDGAQATPRVQFLVDIGDQKETVDELLNKLTAKLEEDGLQKRTVGEMTVFQPKQDQPVDIGYTIQGNTLAIGVDSAALQQTLSRLQTPGGSSLAEVTQFRQFREKASGTGDIEVFINVNRIIPFITKLGFQAQNIVQTFGFDRFEFIGVSVGVGRDGFDILSQSMLVTKGQTPVFNLFNMPAKPTKPQNWVPPTVASYSTFHWDLDLFYNTLSGIIDGFLPGAMQQAEIMVSSFPTPDNPFITSIKGDIIGPLGNRISTVTDIGESRGKPVSRTLIAWELDDADKLNNLIGNVMLLFGPILETKTVKGATVYTYNFGQILEQMPDQQAPLPVGVAGFTVANSHLYLTTHIELLDSVLNFSGAGLAEAPEFRKVAAHFPADTSGISFARSDAQAQMLWQMIKSGQLATLLRQAAEKNQEDGGDLLDGWATALDGSNLPDFEKVSKHFTSSGGFSIMDDNGVYTKSYLLD